MATSANENPFKNLVSLIEQYCGPFDHKTVLEAGVNPYVPDFLAEIDSRYTLTEAVGVNIAIPEPKQFSPTMRVAYGDLRKLGFADQYFDFIVSASVFEHVHSLDVALSEMYRVLKPGALCFQRSDRSGRRDMGIIYGCGTANKTSRIMILSFRRSVTC